MDYIGLVHHCISQYASGHVRSLLPQSIVVNGSCLTFIFNILFDHTYMYICIKIARCTHYVAT